MNTFVPSVIYRSPGFRTVGADVTSFDSAPSFSGTSVSLTPSISSAATAPKTSVWSDLTKGLLNLGGTVATGIAGYQLQAAQIKANAQANRPIVMQAPSGGGFTSFPANPVPASAAYTPSAAPSGGMNKTLLYAGGALALGLVAFAVLRRPARA